MRIPVPALFASGLLGVAVCRDAGAMDLADGLSIGGWGEAAAVAEHRGAHHVRRSAVDPGTSEDAADFTADADLKVLARADDFTLRVDLIASDTPQFQGVGNAYLEQALVDWRFAPNSVLRAGRFQNTWLGWEGFHTPELWRVRHSAAWDWNVQNHALLPNKPFLSDGIGLRLGVDTPVTAEFYVVKDVLGDTPQTRPIDKSVGGAIAWKPEGIGRIELGVAFDPKSTAGPSGEATNALAIDLNTDLTAFRDEGWFFAAEVQVHRHPDLTVGTTTYGNDLVALAMANYAFTERVSVTAMVDWVERGFSAPDNEMVEYALAVLTKPHPRVQAHVEAFVWDERAERADAVGGAAVVLVALP